MNGGISGRGDRTDRVTAERVAEVIADPGLIQPGFQPIVDLRRGLLAGFELLARFTLPGGDRPAPWFAAAAEAGLVAELDARILEIAIEALERLPPNTFLTVNVTGVGASSGTVRATVEDATQLGGLVVELTEQTAVAGPEPLIDFASLLRSRHGLLALDDVGTGYSSLQRLMALRPEFVKLDRSFVSALDTDEAKVAAVEMIGGLANRIDAWVIAEGIEREAELDRLAHLEVPLGQGWLFSAALPEPSFRPPAEVAAMIHRLDLEQGVEFDAIVDHLAPVDAAGGEAAIKARFERDPTIDYVALVDDRRRPVSVIRRSRGIDAAYGMRLPTMNVFPGARLERVAQRAITRPRTERFSPLIYCDGAGRYVGLVAIERLVAALASRPSGPEG